MLDNYVVKDEKENKSFSTEEQYTVPYILMIITNLTIEEKGQKQLFCSDKVELDSVKGVIFLKMFQKLLENIYKLELDFLSSIVANISALQEAREFFFEYKIYEIIMAQISKMNNFKLVNMLRLFRNLCSEYSKYEEAILTRDGYMFIICFRVLVEANIKQESWKLNAPVIDELHLTHFDYTKAEEEKEVINDLIIDIFVTLAGSTKAFPLVVKNGLREVWDKIWPKLNGIKLADRAYVITNFLNAC